jgi:hypothetical protein
MTGSFMAVKCDLLLAYVAVYVCSWFRVLSVFKALTELDDQSPLYVGTIISYSRITKIFTES